jgi:hypothetical protein
MHPGGSSRPAPLPPSSTVPRGLQPLVRGTDALAGSPLPLVVAGGIRAAANVWGRPLFATGTGSHGGIGHGLSPVTLVEPPAPPLPMSQVRLQLFDGSLQPLRAWVGLPTMSGTGRAWVAEGEGAP